MESKSINLVSYCDEGIPTAAHFTVATQNVDTADLQEGEFIFHVLVFSPDPYMRSRMKSGGSYPIGQAINGFVAGEVILSASSDYPVGALLGASLPFQTIQRLSKTKLAATAAWSLGAFLSKADISLGVGIFGMPGATVYGGLLDVLKPKSGETLFVSGAAGAVGSLVGMIAKNVVGCKVVGSCGGEEKCKRISEFATAIDYKKSANTEELKTALKVVAPEGIDMYFDNVGGMHFEAAFQSLRTGGRIAVCGGISQYNSGIGLGGGGLTINPLQMIYTCQRIEGFLSTPYLKDGAFLAKMREWLDSGKISRPDETVFKGIDAFVEAFTSLFTGANTGKVVLMV